LQLANQFRAAILRRERKAALRLIIAYGTIWDKLSKRIGDLNQQIVTARERGEIINAGWLFRQQRYADLLRQVQTEFVRFSEQADNRITRGHTAAGGMGLNDSFELMTTAAEAADLSVTFNTLPVAAVENMAGFLSNSAPPHIPLSQLSRV